MDARLQRSEQLGIDRRQRLAATILLLGFDLPQEARATCEQMLEAASITPGVTMDELFNLGDQTRRNALEAARDLIDEMLREIAN